MFLNIHIVYIPTVTIQISRNFFRRIYIRTIECLMSSISLKYAIKLYSMVLFYNKTMQSKGYRMNKHTRLVLCVNKHFSY